MPMPLIATALLVLTLALAPAPAPVAPSPAASAPAGPIAYSYPLGNPGHPLGDGYFIRDVYTAENTWYNLGFWHTAEDWYALTGDTAGAHVYAVAAGTVVYADADYPGRVVIVHHDDGLYSMYGHLDPALDVRDGQHLARGAPIGTVLARHDGVPSHLHFEIRIFLISPAVNGPSPRYAFRCGPNCPPGPGYWPMDAPDLPSEVGWRNPTHVIAHRGAEAALSSGHAPPLFAVVASRPASATASVRSAPPNEPGSHQIATLALRPGLRLPLLGVYAGPEAPRETSAAAYDLWYEVRLPDGRSGWAQAAIPSRHDTGADGRPSSVIFDFYPDLPST